MPDPNLEPKPGTAQYSLEGTQSLLGLYSMPAISEIPQSTELRMINGVGHGIWFYVDPTPEGEKLIWVSVHVPDPTSEAPCLLTLDPFPQGKAGEKILGLLQKAHRDGSEVLVFSREVSRLGSEDLSIYNRIAFEFRPNGELDFTAHNLSGNQLYGRVSAKGANVVYGRPRAAMFLADLFAQQIRADGRYSFEVAAHRLCSLDPDRSFLLTDGQSPYLDLPHANDADGLRAFALAEQCARKVCYHAGGYGKHHLAAIGPGVAEARLQFPAAPYDLVLRFQSKVITQADFIPKPSSDREGPLPHRFVGEFDLAGGDVKELEQLLIDFAEWGRDCSHKKEGVPPLEQTLAFKALKRLLPMEIHVD